MSKLRKNVTNLKKILSESVVDPNKDKRFKIIADVGNNDYYIGRAIEFINEAQQTNKVMDFNSNIANAISLLALARINNYYGPIEAKKPTARKKDSGCLGESTS